MQDELIKHVQAINSWSDEILAQHLKSWQDEQNELLKEITGEYVLYEQGELVFYALPGHAELARITLYDEIEASQSKARSIALLNPKDNRPQAPIELAANAATGLLLTADQSFLYSRALEKQAFLACSSQWLDTYAEDSRSHHVDLVYHSASQYLFACAREMGEITVISLDNYSELVRWSIRPEGHAVAINIAFDQADDQAYITDNVSGNFWIADLETLENKVWKSGLGVLGAVISGSDQRKIFMSTLAPQFSVMYFDIETMKALYSLDIRGQSFVKTQKLAVEPLLLSPDQKLLHWVTWQKSVHGSEQSVINVIDCQEIVALRRFTPKEEPAMALAYAHPNPFLDWHAFDFKTWLLKHQLISEAQLQQTVAHLNPVKEKPKPAARNFRIYQPPAEDPGLWDKIDQQGDKWELPIAAEEAIVDLLNWAFYRVTLTNLRVHPDELKKLYQMARQIRIDLAEKEVVLAQLENILDKHSFKTPISRRAVMDLVEQGKVSGEMVRFEDLCPICQTPFEESLCPACQFRLSLPPELAHAPGSVSAEPASSLFAGQLLIPHLSQNALLTLNIWRQPLQRIELNGTGILQIGHAIALPNHTFLCSDLKGNKVCEINASGEILWKAKLALKQPVMVTSVEVDQELRFIVVDQGNARVLELDRSGRHWRRYPNLKTPDSDKLKRPCDVQATPQDTWLISDPGLGQVLEVDAKGQVVHRFGATDGVQSPLIARRQPNGHTDIIESTGRCLHFDAMNQSVGAFAFWPPPFEKWADKAAPGWACQIHNGEYLLMGEDYVALVAPLENLVRWVYDLPDPSKEDSLLKVGFRSRSAAEVRKEQLADFASNLKEIGIFEAESEEHLLHLAKFVKEVRVMPEHWLLRPGDQGHSVYFLVNGELDVIADEDEQPVMQSLIAGDVTATHSIFGQENKSYRPGLRSKTEALILSLPAADFKKAVVGFPHLYNSLRNLEHESQRFYRLFAERKTEAMQDQLRNRMAETRIREFGLFAGADDRFFESLADKVAARAYLPEQDVFSRTESGGSLFLILEGQVGVLRQGEQDPVIVLAEGDIFGEMALYFDSPRCATIRTLDYCKFFEIEYRHIRNLSKFFPWFGERLQAMAQERADANVFALETFKNEAGLNRPDLPQVHLEPAAQISNQIFWFASTQHDAVLAFNTLGELTWFWGRTAEQSLFQPLSLHPLAHSVLICDTGNDRVLEVDRQSREILRTWAKGLSAPQAAVLTPEGLLMVADLGNQRLVVLDQSGREVWVHGLPEEIMKPTWVEFSPEGTILFADAGMHRVYELQRDGIMVWKYGKWRNAGSAFDQLDSPSCVRRLNDGSTLIADKGNQRLIWVRPEMEPLVVPLEEGLEPDYCDLLENGDFLVVSRGREAIIKLNRRGDLQWRARLEFSAAMLVAETPVAPAPSLEDRWILDVDRLQELNTNEDQPAEPVAEAADNSTSESLLQELETISQTTSQDDEAHVPQPVFEPLMPELDMVLDDVEQDIKPEAPLAWSDMSFLDQEFNQHHTVQLYQPTEANPVTPETLEDAMGSLFDDEAPASTPMSSNSFIKKMDTLFEESESSQEPSMSSNSFIKKMDILFEESENPQEPLMSSNSFIKKMDTLFDETAAPPEPGALPESLEEAMDSFFDAPEAPAALPSTSFVKKIGNLFDEASTSESDQAALPSNSFIKKMDALFDESAEDLPRVSISPQANETPPVQTTETPSVNDDMPEDFDSAMDLLF